MARAWVTLLSLLSLLVPRELREEWVEEWTAELAATGRSMTDAWGALPDAWTLRTDGWSMDGMWREIRMAVKGLVRKPFFTALAGLTLAIGIGANTAIYSVVDGVLINPLPFPHAEELVSVNHTAPGLNVKVVPHSEAMYLAYHEGFTTLRYFAVVNEDNVNLITDGEPRRISAAKVTREYFDVVGMKPLLGRGFVKGEDRAGAEPVAVLSYSLWSQSFGGDRDVVGRLVELDGAQRRVVGVMPRGFNEPNDAQLWTPLEINATNPQVGNLSYVGLGRMAPGATVAAVQSEMQRLLYQFADAHPDELSRDVMEQAGLQADVKPLKDLYVSDVEKALWVLMGTVGFVLLIACANVANLFLVRAEARQREQALRTALGATKGDMMRHYLTESLMLALGGGVLGLGIAALGVRALLALSPVSMPRADEIGIDGSVLLFTAAISVFAGLLFGLFPVLSYARRDLSGALKEGGRASTGGKERHRARSALVVAQVALALVLLVGSGLMVRSFDALRHIDPGFDASNRLVFRVSLPSAEYPGPEDTRTFDRTLTERLAAIPGVEDVALSNAVPLEGYKSAGIMEAVDHPVPEGELGHMVDRRNVTPGYFKTLGITLVDGRELTWDDAGDGVRSVIVSESLARTLWPGEAAVGRYIRSQGSENPAWQVVGVARDVHYEDLSTDPGLMAYLPMVEGPPEAPTGVRAMSVVLHVQGDPLEFVSAAREALRAVDPRLPLVRPVTMEKVVSDAMAATSFTALLLGIAAVIALVLGTVGIYGVISYVVSRRTQEIGVRMALGAPAAAVLRQVVGQGMVLVGTGVAVGLLGAWGVSRVLTSLLFGVTATDPLTYAGTGLTLTLVALVASWLPARRAARVDPVVALRNE